MEHKEKGEEITTLFLDIGGVLLTNGWDHTSRDLAVEEFNLDKAAMEARHQIAFDTYEMDKMTFDEYLNLTVFYQPQDFSKEDFKAFMFTNSKALGDNLNFFKDLKRRHGLKVIAVSNEGRELNEYRIREFRLDELFDAYVSSCYVHLHKPDKEMLQMACDISHTEPENALYIDDRLILIEVARSFGLRTFHYQDLEGTKEFMATCHFRNGSNKESDARTAI